jgi:hypothetical protein
MMRWYHIAAPFGGTQARRVLATALFLVFSSGCAHGTAIQKIDQDTYRIDCPELPLDRCLAETANNTCDKRAYFVVRGISEVNNQGRSEAPEVSLSSEVIVRCAPGLTFGEQAKQLMADSPADRAKPAAAPNPPQAPAPAAVPGPPSAPAAICAAGSTQACVGAAACQGGQACKADGSGYEPCDCGPGMPGAASGNDSR